jgi:YD repeat-containing protein
VVDQLEGASLGGVGVGDGVEASGFLVDVATPDGRQVGYGYNGSTQLTTVTDARGKVWTYAYDTAGRLANLQDPNTHYRYRNSYDATSGRITQQLDPAGNRERRAPRTQARAAPTATRLVRSPPQAKPSRSSCRKSSPAERAACYR